MEVQLRIPAHVSIIMDGNGRWAQNQGNERVEGHKAGVESVRDTIKAAGELGVKYLSLYAFSEENWGRPEEEVESLMKLMMKSIENEADDLMENQVRFLVLGNRQRLSEKMNKSIDELENSTKDNTRLTLIVFLSYSGKWDILQAVKHIAKGVINNSISEKDIDELTIEKFSQYLVTKDIPDPDIILRTAGEQRISNYLLWQGAYSELIYTNVMWPDFRKADFVKAIEEYSRRDRRFGKVK